MKDPPTKVVGVLSVMTVIREGSLCIRGAVTRDCVCERHQTLHVYTFALHGGGNAWPIPPNIKIPVERDVECLQSLG